MDSPFYDCVLTSLCYFVAFSFQKAVGVTCKHAFGIIVSLISFVVVRIMLIFITLLTISSEWIVILLYNLGCIRVELSFD